MATSVKFLGINDDVTTCECCGRAGLKKTVVLDIGDGDTVHFGTACAAKKLRFGCGVKVSAAKLPSMMSWHGDKMYLAPIE